jgi:FHS family glucose/mannose:H+ symporter-like MFS transporter
LDINISDFLTSQGADRLSDRKWLITSGAFVSMSFIGMSRTFLGTALPAIRVSLDLTFVQAGTLTALLQLGFATSVFIGGPVSDVFKKSSILMLGCLFMGISLLLFGFSEWFWLSLIGIAFIGIGGGLIESSSNPLLTQLFPGRVAMVLQLHHFFFALGSLSGPLIMGAVLARTIPWKWPYIGFGLFVLFIFLFILFQKGTAVAERGGFKMGQIGRFMTEKTFLALFFVTFFTSGVQNGIAFWMVTFLKETKGFPISLASSTLFLFFACMAVGRLFSSYLLTRFHETTYLLSLFSLVFLSLFFSICAPGKWAIPFFALSGLGMSGAFPSLLGMAGKIYSRTPGAAMGILATGAGLGSIIIPWLMSLIAQLTDLRAGFLSFEVFVAFCLFLMGLRFRSLRIVIPLRAH